MNRNYVEQKKKIHALNLDIQIKNLIENVIFMLTICR